MKSQQLLALVQSSACSLKCSHPFFNQPTPLVYTQKGLKRTQSTYMLKACTSRCIVAACKTKAMSSLNNIVLERPLQQLQQLKLHRCVSVMLQQRWITLWLGPDIIAVQPSANSLYCTDTTTDKIKMDFSLRSYQHPQKLRSTIFLQLCQKACADPVWGLPFLHGTGRTPRMFSESTDHTTSTSVIQIPPGYGLPLFHQRLLLESAVNTAFDLNAYIPIC